MEEKKCFKCDEIKPLSEFYKNKGMSDGHVNKCKTCNRKDVRDHRDVNLDRIREYDRTRNTTPERKKMFIEKTKRMRREKKGLQKSHNAVTRAIKKGTLVRPSICSRCPATENIQAHHDDHEKPLDVMWLCPICHAQRHVELGKIRMIDD